MIWEYPATYSDKRGAEETKVVNDARELKLPLRGVMFAGRSFDTLDPQPGVDSSLLKSFTLHHGSLCSCQIDCEMPLPIFCKNSTTWATLGVSLILGEPASNGGLDRCDLTLSLKWEGREYKSNGRSGWFENELLELENSLPGGARLKACISCTFSGYSPYGQGLFGSLACFRACKAEYRQVRNKADLFKLWNQTVGNVQETYVCPEFEVRPPGTAYRG
jgi:hypothetical protein